MDRTKQFQGKFGVSAQYRRLMDSENVIYQGRPSWLSYYDLYFFCAIFVLLFLRSGSISGGIYTVVAAIALAAIFRARLRFTITDHRLIVRHGIVGKNTNEMKIGHIRNMRVQQNPVERLLGIGTVTIMSAADGGSAVVFKGIRDPQRIKEMLNSLTTA